jgi:hypothetical protein
MSSALPAEEIQDDADLQEALAVVESAIKANGYMTLRQLPSRRDTFTSVDQVRRRIQEDQQEGRHWCISWLMNHEVLIRE